MSRHTRRTPPAQGALVGSSWHTIGTDSIPRPGIRITARSPLDGLDLEVDADGLLDDAVTALLARLADETTAAAEDVYRFRFGLAADRCRRIASVLERSQPRLDEWLEARTRRLAEMAAELDVAE